MSASRGRVLVIEDDRAIRTGLEEALGLEGYEVTSARDGEEARDRLAGDRTDLVVLDLMLPERDGLSVLRWLRRFWPDLPVLILSAKTQLDDRVRGLRGGADDYVTKPFALDELLARVEALLRRSRGPEVPIELGALCFDPARRTVRCGEREAVLSRRESELLLYLLRHRGRPVGRDEIFSALWGTFAGSSERQVDYHVARLRKKIEADPAAPRLLVTRHGLGYELRV